MIPVKPSPTGDTRTCNFADVTKDMLLQSSAQHIADVGRGMAFFAGKITEAASVHDADKLTTIDWFLRCFQGGFEDSSWWDNHRKINRHHLAKEDGVPEDVNLVDVIEFIVDCVMAGMARNGSVYDLELPTELLEKAFHNTVEMFTSQVFVSEVEGPSIRESFESWFRNRCAGCLPDYEIDGRLTWDDDVEEYADMSVQGQWEAYTAN